MLAIIPARGGSKRLPGKNIKMLKGRPLISYTIEAALGANLVSRVVVNTDSEKIAKVAKEYGAEVPFIRPPHLGTDDASSIDVLKHTINWIGKHENTVVNELVLLQPTSPLRSSQQIDEAIRLFNAKQAESVISFCAEDHPIHWNKYIGEDGRLKDIFPSSEWAENLKRKITYRPNGAIYVIKSNCLEFNSLFASPSSYAYVMDKESSIDIDTVEDFNYVEYLFS